jgi:hypothetical protein
MNKAKAVAWIVAGVVIFCLLLTLFMPIFTETASGANMTIAATSNWSDYPGSQGALLAMPWLIFFIPFIVGGVLIVIVLKKRD